MQSNAINTAITAFLSQHRDNGAADSLATIVRTAKQATAQRKSMEEGIFHGFLQLAADGVDGDNIKSTGAALRRAVTRIMRVASGFTADKMKGAKESGAPDYSTASVYAKLVCDMLDAQRKDAPLWRLAMETVASAKDTPPALHDASGFYATVGACRRTLAKWEELRAERAAQSLPALYDSPAPKQDVAHLASALHEAQKELEALRAYREATLQPGDAAEMLRVARAERDSEREAHALSNQAAARLRAELEELRAIRNEAARAFGADVDLRAMFADLPDAATVDAQAA